MFPTREMLAPFLGLCDFESLTATSRELRRWRAAPAGLPDALLNEYCERRTGAYLRDLALDPRRFLALPGVRHEFRWTYLHFLPPTAFPKGAAVVRGTNHLGLAFVALRLLEDEERLEVVKVQMRLGGVWEVVGGRGPCLGCVVDLLSTGRCRRYALAPA